MAETFSNFLSKNFNVNGCQCPDFLSKTSDVVATNTAKKCSDFLSNFGGFVASNMAENVPISHKICWVLVKQTAGKCPDMLLEIFMLINVKTINLTPPLCPSSDLKAIIWTWSDSNVSLMCLTHEHWTHRLFADLPTCRSVDWAANVHAACLVHVCFMSTFNRRTRCPHTYSTYTRHMAVNLWMSFQWWQPVHHVAGHVFVLLH